MTRLNTSSHFCVVRPQQLGATIAQSLLDKLAIALGSVAFAFARGSVALALGSVALALALGTKCRLTQNRMSHCLANSKVA